jgi:tRNA(Arg) A34 adenosine deaminase TadA
MINPSRIINLARKTPLVFQAKHAAGLYYKGKLLSTGVNKKKTHPLMAKFSKHPEAVYLHAEIDCIVKCINRYGTEILKECELYVARSYQDGTTAGSRPCEGCSRAIRAFGIPRTYYTTQEGWRTFS